MQQAGKWVIGQLFGSLTDASNNELRYLYASDWRDRVDSCIRIFESSGGESRSDLLYFARDYIAMMTDHHAEELWRRMFSPGATLFTSRL
jgi:dGTP triphosphohydrolase